MKNHQSSAAVAEPAELTWPSPDFLQTAVRKQREIDTAVRIEKDLAQRVASIQDAAFAKGLPVYVIAGGEAEFKKLCDEQGAAALAANNKREELRNFLNSSRAGFFATRERAQEQLHAAIAEQFARAQKLAEELCELLTGSLGVESECERQEVLIRAWNRLVKKYSRTIPSTNVNAIPGVAGIDPAESLRSIVVGMLLSDPNVRELCRGILAREEERRARTVAFEEVRLDEAERLANPASLAEPF